MGMKGLEVQRFRGSEVSEEPEVCGLRRQV